MNVPKNYDPLSRGPIAAEKGTNPFDNAGIKPSESAIPETPGMKASNEPKHNTMSKGQPFGSGGTGYTSGS